MIVGRKYFNNDVFYTKLKKHYCPQCGEQVSCVKVSKIVNSKSSEAKNFDFAVGDSFMSGDIKFIWKEFYCSNCKIKISVDEMKQIEKKLKISNDS